MNCFSNIFNIFGSQSNNGYAAIFSHVNVKIIPQSYNLHTQNTLTYYCVCVSILYMAGFMCKVQIFTQDHKHFIFSSDIYTPLYIENALEVELYHFLKHLWSSFTQ